MFTLAMIFLAFSFLISAAPAAIAASYHAADIKDQRRRSRR